MPLIGNFNFKTNSHPSDCQCFHSFKILMQNSNFKCQILISYAKIKAQLMIGVAQVNLIPLIGKADSFTKEELQEFKQNVSLLIIFENLNRKFYRNLKFFPLSRSATN